MVKTDNEGTMSNLKITFLALAAMLTIWSGTVLADDLCAFEVHYIPLEMECYVPPTPEYLEERGEKSIVQGGALCEIYMDIIGDLPRRPVGFSFTRIRVKIRSIESSKVFYLTADKEVVDEDYLYEVNEQLFEEALKQIKTGLLK